MKIVSLNVGLPREVQWHGQTVTTGIFKEAVDGRIALRKLNLEGDRQADLTVHGGEYKAVYCYPDEHYEFWKQELVGHDLPAGSFGENFTTEGMLEDQIFLGDEFAVGSAQVVVTQPRLPCYKLGIRFGSDMMVKKFLLSGRMGFYLAVTREGEVAAGDEMKLLTRDGNEVAVPEIVRLYVAKRFSDSDVSVARRAMKVAALPESWKEYFRELVDRRG